MEGQPGALQVRDAKASQLNWTASPAPINMAVAAIGSLAPSPQEPPLSLLELLDGFFWWCKDQQRVHGDRTEDGFDRREASSLVHEPCFPRRELSSHRVHKRLQLRGSGAPHREENSQISEGEVDDWALQELDNRCGLVGVTVEEGG